MSITAQDLLAQPEDQYMSAEQLEFFRSLLQGRGDEESLQLASALSEIQRLERAADETDLATIEQQRQELVRGIERRRKALREIDAALERIRSGEYGWCDETGEPIGLSRLIAYPTASLSVESQAIREIKNQRVA